MAMVNNGGVEPEAEPEIIEVIAIGGVVHLEEEAPVEVQFANDPEGDFFVIVNDNVGQLNVNDYRLLILWSILTWFQWSTFPFALLYTLRHGSDVSEFVIHMVLHWISPTLWFAYALFKEIRTKLCSFN